MFDRYQAEVEAVRPAPVESDLRIVYTPVHGCGGETVSALLAGAGHRGLVPVAEQFAPDGTFPTVAFPNPEEPGVLDLALATPRRGSGPPSRAMTSVCSSATSSSARGGSTARSR